jgi:hypothetical protein
LVKFKKESGQPFFILKENNVSTQKWINKYKLKFFELELIYNENIIRSSKCKGHGI